MVNHDMRLNTGNINNVICFDLTFTSRMLLHYQGNGLSTFIKLDVLDNTEHTNTFILSELAFLFSGS